MDGSISVCLIFWSEVVQVIGAGRGNGDGKGISSVNEVFQRGATGNLLLRAAGLSLLGWY
jgi:hypothetical protein